MNYLLQNFKNYLYQLGYSISTQKTLPALVKEFLVFSKVPPLGEFKGANIHCIEQQQIKSFFIYLNERPLKRGSGALSEGMIAQYAYALQTFFSWLEITGQINYNPISGIKFKQPKRESREPLSIEQINYLFEAAVTLQQKVTLHLFYSCGLRRTEAQLLNIRDIHFRDQLLYVREGKGNKRRVIPMTAKVTTDLENYYSSERIYLKAKNIQDELAFVLNRFGNRMSGESYGELLKTIIKKSVIAHLSPVISLHHLRHSIATHLLQGGMGMEYVRDFLGHRFLDTTLIYAKVNAAQIRLL
jgi:integrase/recombinase XerD